MAQGKVLKSEILGRIKNIGPGWCDVCQENRQDVVLIKKNWFTSVSICDRCGHIQFLSYSKTQGGPMVAPKNEEDDA